MLSLRLKQHFSKIKAGIELMEDIRKIEDEEHRYYKLSSAKEVLLGQLIETKTLISELKRGLDL